jgi:protein gp37
VAESTPIEWADSTVNAMMGCDGCELWDKKTGKGYCYAAAITEERVGRTPQVGWPIAFGKPEIFPGRIEKAATWKDLTGMKRLAKPWLDDLPRVIFLDDMGDTFTESLPVNWLAPSLSVMADSRHLHLILTKRVPAAVAFSHTFTLPANLWIGASVTSPKQKARLDQLRGVQAALRFASIEPLTDELDLTPWLDGTLQWVICGGGSSSRGRRAKPFRLSWARRLRDACADAGVPFFMKQTGSHGWDGTEGEWRELRLLDGKGANWNEWPADLRVRQMPRVKSVSAQGALL